MLGASSPSSTKPGGQPGPVLPWKIGVAGLPQPREFEQGGGGDDIAILRLGIMDNLLKSPVNGGQHVARHDVQLDDGFRIAFRISRLTLFPWLQVRQALSRIGVHTAPPSLALRRDLEVRFIFLVVVAHALRPIGIELIWHNISIETSFERVQNQDWSKADAEQRARLERNSHPGTHANRAADLNKVAGYHASREMPGLGAYGVIRLLQSNRIVKQTPVQSGASYGEARLDPQRPTPTRSNFDTGNWRIGQDTSPEAEGAPDARDERFISELKAGKIRDSAGSMDADARTRGDHWAGQGKHDLGPYGYGRDVFERRGSSEPCPAEMAATVFLGVTIKLSVCDCEDCVAQKVGQLIRYAMMLEEACIQVKRLLSTTATKRWPMN